MKIYTLTLSPCYDLHASAEKIVSGKENSATLTSREAGGKGINISRALLALGIKSEAILAIGKENSELFKSELENAGIDARYYSTDGRIRENLTIHTKDQKETRISLDGAPVYQSTLDEILNDTELQEGDIFTFTGSAPKSLTNEQLKDFIFKIKERGARVVIDSKSLSLADIRELSPWLIKPNEEEICTLLQTDKISEDMLKEKARELCDGGIENAMISLGEKGAILATKKATYTAEPPKITPISTIGAGDSTIAGFIAATALGLSESDTLRLAIASGSAACLTEGTHPPKINDINEIYSKVKIK